MKRYNTNAKGMSGTVDMFEFDQGEWVKYTDHEAERKELYETIDRNSKKIIKLKSELEDYQAIYMNIESDNHRLKEQLSKLESHMGLPDLKKGE